MSIIRNLCVAGLIAYAGASVALASGGGGDDHAAPAKSQPAKPSTPQIAPATLDTGAAKPKATDSHDAPANRVPRVPASPRKSATGQTSAAAGAHAPAPSHDAPAPKPLATKPASPAPSAEAMTNEGEIMSAAAALAALTEGNARWVGGKPTSPNTNVLRRQQTASEGQHPFATVLTCADSRIPVERVFDRGVGEVFVVRVAGNVTDAALTGTVEYGIDHLNTPLLVVMGHSGCGAVKATIEGAHVTSNIAQLVSSIKPAVERAKQTSPGVQGEALLAASVKENVWQTIFDLYKTSPAIVKMVGEGKVKVVGAVLDISTGNVEWLGEHPWQGALVSAFARQSDAAPVAAAVEPPAAQPVAGAEHAGDDGH